MTSGDRTTQHKPDTATESPKAWKSITAGKQAGKNLHPIEPETISGLYKPIRTETASHRDRYKRTRDRIRHGDKTARIKDRLKVSETAKGF